MNKLYLIILTTCFTLFAGAQTVKNSEVNFSAETVRPKVLRFYPNPAVSVINFEFLKPVEGTHTLQVYNFVGKKVYELNAVSQKTTVPLTEFYRGV